MAGVAAAIRDAPLRCRPDIENVQVLAGDRVGPLLEWREVVENPDRPPVRTEDEVVVARVDGDVVDRYCRQIELDARPVRAEVVGHEQAALRARPQHVRIARIFANDVYRAGFVADTVADRLP